MHQRGTSSTARISGFQSEDEGSIPSFPSIREVEKMVSRKPHALEFRVRIPVSLPLFVMPYKGPEKQCEYQHKRKYCRVAQLVERLPYKQCLRGFESHPDNQIGLLAQLEERWPEEPRRPGFNSRRVHHLE